MLIEVTQECINNGLACDTAECPIALALSDAGFTNVQVDEYESTFSFRNVDYAIGHTIPVYDFIILFDACGEVRPLPFSFELNLEPA